MGSQLTNRRAFRDIEVDIIQTDFDLRESVDEEGITGLTSTMEAVGILQPILVSLDSRNKQYKLVIGGRRLRAAKAAGSRTIPSFIVDDIDDRQALILALIENMQRQDLEPLEEARGMAELRDRFHQDETNIAITIGRNEEFVHNRLSLLALPNPIQQLLAQRRLNVSQVLPLTQLESKHKTQLEIAEMAMNRQLTAEVVERMVEESRRSTHRKMKRKHWVKRRGPPLSEEHMHKTVQQVVLRGERLTNFLADLPLQRWSSQGTQELGNAISAIRQELQRIHSTVTGRAKKK